MKITTKTEYEPKAGDVLKWTGTDKQDKILFVVLNNNDNQLVGVTLFDTRSGSGLIHMVYFHAVDGTNQLQLIVKSEDACKKMNNILIEWVNNE